MRSEQQLLKVELSLDRVDSEVENVELVERHSSMLRDIEEKFSDIPIGGSFKWEYVKIEIDLEKVSRMRV